MRSIFRVITRHLQFYYVSLCKRIFIGRASVLLIAQVLSIKIIQIKTFRVLSYFVTRHNAMERYTNFCSLFFALNKSKHLYCEQNCVQIIITFFVTYSLIRIALIRLFICLRSLVNTIKGD